MNVAKGIHTTVPEYVALEAMWSDHKGIGREVQKLIEFDDNVVVKMYIDLWA